MNFDFIKTDSVLKPDSFFTHINSKSGHPIELSNKGIAFITDTSPFSAYTRKYMDKFKNHFRNIAIYDMGSLSEWKEDIINDIIIEFYSRNIIPIFIGINNDNTGVVTEDQKLHRYLISNRIKSGISEKKGSNSFLCYQRHLCDLSDIQAIEDSHYNSMSLGKMRSYLYLAEPILRDCEILHIDLSAMRSSDCPGIATTLPTGLNAEELCQLARYAGSANQLRALSIGATHNPEHPETAILVAESIWYLAEGFNHLYKNDYPAFDSNYSSLIITGSEEDLTFVKNNSTGRYWIRKETEGKEIFMACSQDEYQLCSDYGITERISKFLNS